MRGKKAEMFLQIDQMLAINSFTISLKSSFLHIYKGRNKQQLNAQPFAPSGIKFLSGQPFN